MAVLVHLAKANGRVVSRNDIMDAVWPRMAVTGDALSQCLVELRKAFRDDSRRPRVIETIHKIGVRLIAKVTPSGAVGGGAAAPHHGTLAVDAEATDPLLGADFKRLTEFAGSEEQACISRDGRFVAFISDRDGPRTSPAITACLRRRARIGPGWCPEPAPPPPPMSAASHQPPTGNGP